MIDYSEIVKILIEFTWKGILFSWLDQYKKSFEFMKTAFASTSSFHEFEADTLLFIEINASDSIFDCNLSHYDEN
jgi:hypothetical protein